MKKYPWPASGISEKEMQMLYNMRQKTNIPITKLVKEAIERSYGKKGEP